MIGKTIYFHYNGHEMHGEILDKVIVSPSQGYVETAYLVSVGGKLLAVRINNITKLIL